MALEIIKLTKSKSKLVFKNALSDDVLMRFPNTEKAENELNYSPKINLEEGLKRTIAYYRQNL